MKKLLQAISGLESRENDPYNALNDEEVLKYLNEHYEETKRNVGTEEYDDLFRELYLVFEDNEGTVIEELQGLQSHISKLAKENKQYKSREDRIKEVVEEDWMDDEFEYNNNYNCMTQVEFILKD